MLRVMRCMPRRKGCGLHSQIIDEVAMASGKLGYLWAFDAVSAWPTTPYQDRGRDC